MDSCMCSWALLLHEGWMKDLMQRRWTWGLRVGYDGGYHCLGRELESHMGGLGCGLKMELGLMGVT